MTEVAKKDLRTALEIVWKRQEGIVQQEANRLSTKANELRKSIPNQINEMTNPANVSIKEEIRRNIERTKNEAEDLEKRVENLEVAASMDKARFLKFALDYVDDLATHFFELSREKQLVCKQLVFPAGFWVNENKKIYTPEVSELYRLARNKKDLPITEKSLLVRVKRL